MNNDIKIIEGEIFTDHRGIINSLNTFDPEAEGVRRVYFIYHPDPVIVRGWHAHQHERKWFYCVKGSFALALVKIDDWENPSNDLKTDIIELSEHRSRIVCVPAGYGNCLKAHEAGSVMMVMSDVEVPRCYGDSWRYPSEMWVDPGMWTGPQETDKTGK